MEENKEVKKLSYEELEKVAHELNNQCQTLYKELQNTNMLNTFKRLDYLFKVVENIDVFPQEFAKHCIEEVVDIMTVPVEETTNEK